MAELIAIAMHSEGGMFEQILRLSQRQVVKKLQGSQSPPQDKRVVTYLSTT